MEQRDREQKMRAREQKMRKNEKVIEKLIEVLQMMRAQKAGKPEMKKPASTTTVRTEPASPLESKNSSKNRVEQATLFEPSLDEDLDFETTEAEIEDSEELNEDGYGSARAEERAAAFSRGALSAVPGERRILHQDRNLTRQRRQQRENH